MPDLAWQTCSRDADLRVATLLLVLLLGWMTGAELASEKGDDEREGHNELVRVQPLPEALQLRRGGPQPQLQGTPERLLPSTADRQGSEGGLDEEAVALVLQGDLAAPVPLLAVPDGDLDALALSSLATSAPLPAVPDVLEERFRQGYRAAGGPEEWLDHFLLNVLPCEAGVDAEGNIDWTPGNADYRSAAQFHPQSWERVEREVGYTLRFEEPYGVGGAAATWLRLIGPENIATNAGWPYCGR